MFLGVEMVFKVVDASVNLKPFPTVLCKTNMNRPSCVFIFSLTLYTAVHRHKETQTRMF